MPACRELSPPGLRRLLLNLGKQSPGFANQLGIDGILNTLIKVCLRLGQIAFFVKGFSATVMLWTVTSLAHLADQLWNPSTISNFADETRAELLDDFMPDILTF
jgi:hypothetical protein